MFKIKSWLRLDKVAVWIFLPEIIMMDHFQNKAENYSPGKVTVPSFWSKSPKRKNSRPDT